MYYVISHYATSTTGLVRGAHRYRKVAVEQAKSMTDHFKCPNVLFTVMEAKKAQCKFQLSV